MEDLFDIEIISHMDALWDSGQAFRKGFREKIDSGSQTARSIDRGDCWSETASWARRDGYHAFAKELDHRTIEYNALIPHDHAH